MSPFVPACGLVLAMCGSGPTYRVQQASLVTLPSAPPPAASFGDAAAELGVDVPTEVEAGGAGRVAVPAAQPEAGLSVRVAEGVALRGWFALGPGEGHWLATTAPATPTSASWAVAGGPSFRLFLWERVLFVEVAPTLGVIVVPSSMITTSLSGDGPASSASSTEVEALVAASLRLGARPAPWLGLHAGATARTQPLNRAEFSAYEPGASSLGVGRIALIVHGGAQLDLLDEFGIRVDVQWPLLAGASYGPIVGLSVIGRLDATRASPLGAAPWSR